MRIEKATFGGLEYIVIDKFTFENVDYMYIFEDISEKIKGKKFNELDVEAKADFIFKCPDGKYENVVDDELYNKLLRYEHKRNSLGINKIIKEYFKLQ